MEEGERSTKRPRRKSSDEYKRDAVEIVRSSGQSIAELRTSVNVGCAGPPRSPPPHHGLPCGGADSGQSVSGTRSERDSLRSGARYRTPTQGRDPLSENASGVSPCMHVRAETDLESVARSDKSTDRGQTATDEPHGRSTCVSPNASRVRSC